MKNSVKNVSHKAQEIPSKKSEKLTVLATNKVRELLNNLHGWHSTEDHKMIYGEFILQDFTAAIDLIDSIALIAESEKHHPDIHLTQYRNLRVGLTTHDVGGLSEKDFAVAFKINDLSVVLNKHNNGVSIDQKAKKKVIPIQRLRSVEQKDKKTKVIKSKKVLNRIAKPLKRV